MKNLSILKSLPYYSIFVTSFIVSLDSALAHDIWITTNKSGDLYSARIYYGDFDAREYADKYKITSLDVVSSSGVQHLSRPYTRIEEDGVESLEASKFSASSDAVLSVVYDNGYWIRRPQDRKEVNSIKALIAGGTDSYWTIKYGKNIMGAGAYKHVLNTRLELIPLEDPFTLQAGKKLKVKLLLEGKPLAGSELGVADGVQLTPEDQVLRVKTDKDGIAEIDLTRKGPYVIITDHYTDRSKTPEFADRDHIYSSLSFDTSR